MNPALNIVPRQDVINHARTKRDGRGKGKIHKVRVGNVTIEFRIFEFPNTNRDGSVRMRTELRTRGAKRQTFKTRAAAVERAEEIAPEIAAGRAPISPESKQLFGTITRQWLEYRRVTRDERAFELVTGELFTEKARAIAGAPKTSLLIPALVTQFLADLEERSRRQGSSLCHWRNCRGRLNRFAADFTGPIDGLTPGPVEQWLKRLRLKPKTVNHYRAAIVEAVKFAKSKSACTREIAEGISAIKPYKLLDRVATPYTAGEMRRILDYAQLHRPKHVPRIVLVAFCGLRVCEVASEKGFLDWRDIDFRRRKIRVRAELAKKRKKRDAYFPDNAHAWLKLYAQPSGPVCSVTRSSEAFTRICVNAEVERKRNGERSGCITKLVDVTNDLKFVARVAGTSVDKIESNYYELPDDDTDAIDSQESFAVRDAKAWFNIFPADSQLRLAFPASPHSHHAGRALDKGH